MSKKNPKQTDLIRSCIDCKRAILHRITDALEELIKREAIDGKMPRYKWQNDAEAKKKWNQVFASYDNALIEYNKTGILQLENTPTHTGIIKDQQTYYSNVFLRYSKYFDKIMERYSIAKDVNDFLIQVEINYADFLSKVYTWDGVRGKLVTMGRMGGWQDTTNQPILLAVTQYLRNNPKLNDKPDNQIAESFKKNVTNNPESEPLNVRFDGCEWEVYYADGFVWATPGEIYGKNGKNKKHKDASRAFATFRKTYIPKAKEKLIKETKK